MSKANETRNEINAITSRLIELGICDDQKYAIVKKIGRKFWEVTFESSGKFSHALKDVPYDETYKLIKNERDYNIALADGALVQLNYKFKDDVIQYHRLAFLPSPDLSSYQNDPEIYEEDAIYSEIISKSVVTTPMRFDFDRSIFQEYDHPMAHLTIGQYKNCRIPVKSAISPARFIEFVLCSFYNTAFRNYRDQIGLPPSSFLTTITPNEAKKIHIGLESED